MKRGHLPQPGRCLRWLLFLVLAGGRMAPAVVPPSGEGEPFVRYFPPEDYHGSTQCFGATQDVRGVIYVGSLGMVLDYDGSTWRKIHVDSNIVAAIAYQAETDTVFVGAENNLGYLKTLPGGGRVFVSLLATLPANARDVGTVYGVQVTPAGVFFVGTRRVMRWRDGVFKTWEFATVSRLKSDWAAGSLYVSSPEVGLLRLENDGFAPASNDPLFRRASVRSILATPDGALLIGTFHDGLFTLRDGAVRPLESECGGFLKEKGILKMLRLRDGSMAVATDTAGLLILDPALRFRSHADDTGGLHGTNIFNLFEDAEGGIWIGLQSGVARAEVDPMLSVLRAGPQDDMSEAYCADQWFGATVVGTATGLYRVVPANPSSATSAHLEQFPGIRNLITSVCTVENGLLMISNGKIALLDAGAQLIPTASEIAGAQSLCASRLHPGRVYVIDEGGRISGLRLDGATQNWVNAGIVADLGAMGGEYGLVESAGGDLWVETKEHGLFRVALAPDGPATVTSFLDRPGPLHGEPTVMLSSGDGPLRFLGAHTVCGLDPSAQTIRPLTEFGPRFHDGSLAPATVVSCDAQSLWITAAYTSDPMGDTLRGRAIAGGPGHAPAFQSLPYKIDALIGGPGILFPVNAGPGAPATLLLIGTGRVVVRMDVPRWETREAPRPFATLIRRAVTTAGAPAADPPPILGDALPYKRNSVRFEFAANTFAFGAAPRFQTRLANVGTGAWSDFSDRASVEYLNLPEGRYTFEVRARNADGQLGSVASVPFRILPPWQRTPWAYAVYVLTLALAVAAYVQWRARLLRHRNAVLEALVTTRTSELRGRETELLGNERALVRARDDAESANRAKSAFLANMSHELRTPLNAVLGYTQLLLKQGDLSARSRERIAVIGQSGGHLLSLVNEVLDLSKVEAGKLTLSRVDFSLPQLLDEVRAAFRPRFAEKGLTFTETRAPGLPTTVHTDPSRLRQVLFNLLSNAAKFTHRGGVTLEVRPAGDGQVSFEVTDTGVGIDPRELRNIFVAFHQAANSNLASQGTGLGLTISQRLVGLLGGQIEVASAPGQGSRFGFSLPLPEVLPLHGLPARVYPDPALGKVTGYEGATRRLLLVDDLTQNRLVLRDFLLPLGFEIEEASDGVECLAACARQMPDALLLDLRLGDVDGFQVARSLRARLDGAPLGIIAISASVFESDRQQALDAGCDDFLPKPFEEAQLMGVLGRVLALRWVQATPAEPEPAAIGAPADGEKTLPPGEINTLLELSLRGDAAEIRRRLGALRAAGLPGGATETVRQLDALVASFDMEGIHARLLTLHSHDGK